MVCSRKLKAEKKAPFVQLENFSNLFILKRLQNEVLIGLPGKLKFKYCIFKYLTIRINKNKSSYLSSSGNRTPIASMTGRYTYHYTIEGDLNCSIIHKIVITMANYVQEKMIFYRTQANPRDKKQILTFVDIQILSPQLSNFKQPHVKAHKKLVNLMYFLAMVPNFLA